MDCLGNLLHVAVEQIHRIMEEPFYEEYRKPPISDWIESLFVSMVKLGDFLEDNPPDDECNYNVPQVMAEWVVCVENANAALRASMQNFIITAVKKNRLMCNPCALTGQQHTSVGSAGA
jgi:hypothetical protein